MKLYKVYRTTETHYDEYDGFVIRAENEERALALCKVAEGTYRPCFIEGDVVFVELKEEGIEEIILASYNAG